MEGLLWIVILGYIFGVGYFAAMKLDRFVRRNPKAFPRRRRILRVPPPNLKHNLGDDETQYLWYNESSNYKE